MARVADFSTKVRVSELTTGREVRTFDGGAELLCLSEDGKRLAVVREEARSPRSTLIAWDVSTGAELQKVVLRDSLRAITFDSHGELLALAANDGPVRVIDFMKGAQTRDLEDAGRSGADSLAFSPDDHLLAGGSPAGDIRVWDLSSGRLVRTFNVQPAPGDRSVASHVEFTPDGAKLAAGTDKAGWAIWELSGGRRVSSIGKNDAALSAFALSPDGVWLAGGGENASVTVWNLATNRVVMRLNPVTSFKDSRLQLPITALAFSPDATLLIAGTAAGAQLWQRIQ
jgi:WD40 repeat protein